MSPLSALEMQRKINMRPTLLIGIGGTGQKVLIQLKARFLRNYGEVPRAVSFLCFDTDPAAEKTKFDDREVSLVTDTELINLGGIETQNIIKNLDRYPAISSWIIEDKERIPTRAVVQGAMQVRPIGRLALFWKVETMFSKMMEAIRGLTRVDDFTNEERGVNIFIISSVCGGTGSGSILDVAYLSRQALDRSGISSSLCYINAVLALPSVFPNVAKIGIESNAYATLTEVDYFMETGSWNIDYGNPRVATVEFENQRPFNICYLIDARNESGKGLSGMEEIAPMIAEGVYLQVSSQVGKATNSVFDNVRVLGLDVQDLETGKRKPTAYSSFGTASLVFPAEKIIEICAQRLGRDLINGYLMGKPLDMTKSSDINKVDGSINSFLQSSQLEPETLLQQLARDSKANIIRIQMDPRVLDKFKEAELMGAMQAYVTREDNRLENETRRSLDENKRIVTEVLTEKLLAEVDRLVNDPTFGLQYGTSFMARMDERLAAIRSEMEKSRSEMESKRDRAQGNLRMAMDGMNQALRSGPFGHANRVKDARNRYIQVYTEYLTAKFEGLKREIAISILASLSTVIQNRRAALQATIDRLQFIQNQFDTFVTKNTGSKAKPDFVLAMEITDDADIEKYFTDHFKRLGTAPAGGLIETQGPINAWLEMDQLAIANRVLAYTRSVFADIREISIENILVEKRELVDPIKRLQDLINRSVPFWMFREAGVLGQEWENDLIIVVGVPDKERSIFTNFTAKEGQTSLTSTFDKHTITVLQTKHGVPLFALTQYRDFKQAHDHVLRTNMKPLYVIPEVRPGGEKAKQVFALGVAYGYIFKSGVYYPDTGRPPIRLDQGMEASLNSFRNNEELITHVASLVEEQISREGVDSAITLLEGFINEPFVYELKGGPKINIDRTGMTKDLSVGKPGSANFELAMGMRDVIRNYIKKVLRG
jgi:hypothetical protein